MQNGALQDYPLDEDDLENFYMRNLSRFVVVTLGSQGLPRSSQGLPRGSQGLLGVGWGLPRAPGGFNYWELFLLLSL